ncbi:oxidoreductase [Lentibacillus kapialis]|uniref:Oxidoreductase n=1 Tax=Lentibacillus kapialis TaxID=340214 RepID=A0A917PMX9_9BACI|nr:SDR family oxidoreductase [Lentibacillus kapialis]GGJ84696.1 oxidoreductase [Lentibacillus kapialis]
MNIYLLGATGRVGREILKKAIADRNHITALVRTPEKLRVKSDFLSVIQGNVLDEEAVRRSMSGTSVVISALSTNKNQTLSKSMPYIVQSMKEHELNRIVTIGTAGILNSRKRPGMYRFQTNESKRKSTVAAEDHLAAFQLLKNSNLTWTVVCPTYLPAGEKTGKYRTADNELPENGTKISVGDTAAFAYKELTESTFLHKRVGIAY